MDEKVDGLVFIKEGRVAVRLSTRVDMLMDDVPRQKIIRPRSGATSYKHHRGWGASIPHGCDSTYLRAVYDTKGSPPDGLRTRNAHHNRRRHTSHKLAYNSFSNVAAIVF